MVRVPCCENMGLKKGPWTPEEDQILVSYIQRYGHSNWRALPKQAGLLRCGKSCRLRWINYLRPDIKRGNFTNEEEETIVKLHQILGNRWSAIAAKLPGRTDNEIKNYWHTHLKKRLEENSGTPSSSSSGHFTGKSRNEFCTEKSRTVQNVNFITTNQTFFQKEPCELELSSSTANVKAIDGFGLNTVNETEFWYDLFMKAGNYSREVHGN